MTQLSDAHLRPVFQPEADGPVRAVVVAGACGNVGFGKLGQFARLLAPKGIPVVALDLSDAVSGVKEKLEKAYGGRFDADTVATIMDGITIVQGGIDDLPADMKVGFVFEAIPERLDIKHSFYAAIRKRDPEAFIFSATSGFPSTMLFDQLEGKERCGVMHPFFPHLTNKLWEVPVRGAVTGKDELKTIKRFLGGLGMNLIPTADVPSFAADRLFCGMMLEAVRIHDDLGLSPAEVDDVCKKTLGTSPFFVHNLIPGANYLSAHCMELMQGEVDSTLFSIPEVWKPYIEDPKKQWPYERGQKCPPETFEAARDRMLGMLISLTAYMLKNDVASLDAINFLAENALAFREGLPALIENLGFEKSKAIAQGFLEGQKITHAEQVAPLSVLAEDGLAGKPVQWWNAYVHTAVHDGVGLLSLKRTTISHTFIAELDRAIDALQANDAVRAIVIAPDGSFSREFGHGASLLDFVPVLGKEDEALALIDGWKATLSKLRAGKPTVAALVGRVLGGSLEFALSCHARIAGKGTRLQFPETTVGVIPGLGGCHHAHRFSAPEHYARINEILLTGHGFKADEAHAMGLVTDVVAIADLPAASMKLAAGLASGDVAMPAFRDDAARLEVDRTVATTNEAGVPLDADLRELLAATIEQANALPYADGSALEAKNAAKSLAMSSSAIGVKAMLRGKPAQFENPLG
ncbi:MAG: 3-hydroxyacyl-CoA dehydrogenase/enoyl-CoA hydratase family protein [Nannocystaceae bacterium]|nr:3-hydroxyacyl-CoA dehydrogenase NAD-binding domain-containing protein [bacterium]